ncbi:MAG: TIGR02594 family protein, partial [Candidatus Competibacteraceae bacterium]|nr:TIGR02594 family protein [Candidatus Competibacteraceae bacterium]
MSLIRVYTNLTPSHASRIIGQIRIDNGTFEQIDQGDGNFTIIARFPVPEPAAEIPERDAKEFGWMKIAMGELGQKEVVGGADNPRIVQYHATTSLGPKPDSVPWCSSFVNFCVEKSGISGTDSAAARSWMEWGRATRSLVPGCIVVLKRGEPPKGHVGFFIGKEGNRIRLLGGNQNDAVNIASFDADRVIAKRLPPSGAVSAVASDLNRWLAALAVA